MIFVFEWIKPRCIFPLVWHLVVVTKEVLILAVVRSLVLEDHVAIARFAPRLTRRREPVLWRSVTTMMLVIIVVFQTKMMTCNWLETGSQGQPSVEQTCLLSGSGCNDWFDSDYWAEWKCLDIPPAQWWGCQAGRCSRRSSCPKSSCSACNKVNWWGTAVLVVVHYDGDGLRVPCSEKVNTIGQLQISL